MEEVSKNSFKVKQIIDVAQELFGLYGLEKVSMQEIADELNFSKASIYYYFPDKESLYEAVLEKEHNEFILRISEIIREINDPAIMLKDYARLRLEYFNRLLNLSRLRLEIYSEMKPGFRDSLKIFKEKEKELVKEILNKGLSSGLFAIEDTGKTASLFLDLLKGLRVTVISGRRTLTIEQSEYDRLLENTKAFTDIFIKGLKIK
jgi:TetR/AcrR family transcriptional regulator